MTKLASSKREEFRVVISGIELSDADRDRINTAVQQAALGAIGELKIPTARRTALVPVNPGTSKLPEWWTNPGGTKGIWIGDIGDPDFGTFIKGQ